MNNQKPVLPTLNSEHFNEAKQSLIQHETRHLKCLKYVFHHQQCEVEDNIQNERITLQVPSDVL